VSEWRDLAGVLISFPIDFAGVMELADMQRSERCERKLVGVQISPPALVVGQSVQSCPHKTELTISFGRKRKLLIIRSKTITNFISKPLTFMENPKNERSPQKESQNTKFRALVEGLFTEGTDLDKGVLDAIEQNRLSSYPIHGDRRRDAVECLIHIYDELAKENPEESFIEQTVERLKEYL